MARDIIAAVHLRTESGDDYLFLFDDVFGTKDFVEKVEDCMGDELEYVYHVSVRTDCCADSEYTRALHARIEEMQGE